MKNFSVKFLTSNDIESELEKIGFDSGYKAIASEKFRYQTLKIFDLNPAQANIIKQLALSVGADCATHHDVITGKIDSSNAILGGSISQLKKIAQKLQAQPFSLKTLAEDITKLIKPQERKTKLVGIVNVTPDSFSDGGDYLNPQDAISHALRLIEDGADILDIGAESTKPFAKEVPAEEQIKRLAPVLEGLKDIKTPISVDTRSAKIAEYALLNGASIINDVSGFDYDSDMPEIVAKYNATVILQHSKGTPANMQINPVYNDVVEEVYLDLLKKAKFAKSKGIKNIILDIGIGFGKTREDNYKLLNCIEDFYSLNLPLMVGVSRKSLLALENTDNSLKDTLSAAISYPLIKSGIDYLRVHNVKLHKQLINSAIF